MRPTRRLQLCVLFMGLALAATPALAARSSRDGFSGPGRGKLGPDLFLAITHGDLASVESLLARGADPNAQSSLGDTPMLAAAGSRQAPMVEALLRAGAKLDAPTLYGTALTGAAAGGSAPVIKLLLARGADVHAQRPDGITVLMYAALNGDPEIVRDLLSRKADVDAKDGDGAAALTYAARNGHVDAGRVLLTRGAVVDAADSHRWTALMNAAVNGHAEFVKLLLEKGAKANAREEKGRTPLILAASYGDHPAVLRALVDGGADRRATDARGRNALALAAARGYGESAAFLRERGADPSLAVGSEMLRTPHEAAQTSLTALQRSMGVFNRMTGCVSCHQDGLGRMATGVARQHGLAIDAAVAQAQVARISAALTELRPRHVKALKDPRAMKDVPLVAIGDVTSYYAFLLAGVVAHKQPANQAVSATTLVLARQQFPDGHWFSGPRGPMQSSYFTITALTVQAMRTYAPREHAAEAAGRLRRARAWLLTAPAKTSEDQAFRLLGLKWAGSSLEERRKAIEELRAGQRPDGGWPQPGSRQSDAYGTGQALYALRVAGGLPVTDPVYQRGVQFLLRTQEEDGSWFVTKRAIPANNYFDAAFPHGESQYSSFNATCWATMALVLTVPPTAASRTQAIPAPGRVQSDSDLPELPGLSPEPGTARLKVLIAFLETRCRSVSLLRGVPE
jgi:ankyrin repeat protein